MDCEKMLLMLNEYVDGDINPEVCEQFRHHLQGCNPCRIVVDNIRNCILIYKGTEVYELPVDFRSKLRDSIRRHWVACHGEITPE